MLRTVGSVFGMLAVTALLVEQGQQIGLSATPYRTCSPSVDVWALPAFLFRVDPA